MQIREMVGAERVGWVMKNRFLCDYLKKLNIGERIAVIKKYILDYALEGDETQAIQMLQLLWPSMVVNDLTIARINDGPVDSVTLKLEGLSNSEIFGLENALDKYAQFIRDTLLNFTSGAKPVPVGFMKYAGLELLAATHMMSDKKKVQEHFEAFLYFFTGWRESGKCWYVNPAADALKDVPAIVRDALKTAFYRKEHNIRNNMLAYLLGIKHRFKEEEQLQTLILKAVAEVIMIAIIRLEPDKAFRDFVTEAELEK